jgi:hypothetical protein
VGLFALVLVATAQAQTAPPNTASTSRAEAERAVDSYVSAMNTRDFSDVPLTPNLIFRGSLHTEPVEGDSAYRTFFLAVAKGARSVKLKWRVIDGERACILYEYERNTGEVIPVVACFRFEGRQIAEERAFFDPRPFLLPCQSGKETHTPE